MPSRPMAGSDTRLQSVIRLAESCGYEEEHTRQVTRLALRLFDELQPLHGLGAEERFLLECAALLHDIGWVEGQAKHHKTALRIVLTTPLLPFDTRERFVVGSIARYHRKALPGKRHDHFATLAPADQAVVSVLAGILRVADGLDRTHRSVVEDLTCSLAPGEILLQCKARPGAQAEREVALEKGKLLEQVSGRRLRIEISSGSAQ